MGFQGRAYYNLLQMGLIDDPNAQHEPWETLDYRSLKTSHLFEFLQELEVFLDLDSFLLYSQRCESPEEITETLVGDQEDEIRHERTYLVIFELWRRYCKDKESLSVFCDELDHLIWGYDQGEDNDDVIMQKLGELEDILYDNTEEKEEAEKVFLSVSDFTGHDLEEFIYDFAANLLDKEKNLASSEICDGFYDYVTDKRWFDFLRVRLVSLADSEEASYMLEHLCEKLEDDPILDLYFEILKFLIHQEGISLFSFVVEKIEPLLQKEEDFQDFCEILLEYFNSLDKEEEESKVESILMKRELLSKEKEFSSQDPDFTSLKKLVSSTTMETLE